MNPWTIIGWTVVGVLSVIGLGIAIFSWDTVLKPGIARRIMHRRTRNIAPAPAQVWMQGDSYLTVTRIHENGRIGVTTKAFPNSNLGASISWADTPDEWARRVRNRKLWLLKECPVWARHLGLEESDAS